MNELVVDTKYRAIARFEQEIGFQVKNPVLDSIFDFVEISGFGEDNDSYGPSPQARHKNNNWYHPHL
jgi:hypothetical protein